MPECSFCRIAEGKIPAQMVYADDLILAILDIAPIRPGHTLILPRRHYDYFDDLPEDVASLIFGFGQRLARAMKQLYGVERVGFAFTGGDFPHAHAHVVPLHEKTDITSRQYIRNADLVFGPAPSADPESLAQTAHDLRAALGKLDRV